MVAAVTGVMVVAARRRLMRGRSGLGRRRSIILGAALDDLVELAAIEPDAAALRAIVDFDALPFAHHQRHAADGAGHGLGIGHQGLLGAWHRRFRRAR